MSELLAVITRHMSELAAGITSLATLAIALATLFTVLEMRSQRKEARRPELLPVRQMVYCRDLAISNQIYGGPHWYAKEAEQTTSPYSIPIFNIGSGPAKDVSVCWEYPVDQLVEELNRALQQALQDVFLQRGGGDIGVDILKVKSKSSQDRRFINAASGIGTNIEYILSSAIAEQPTLVQLPVIFITLCSLCVALSAKTENASTIAETLWRASTLQMRIRYRDLANAKYERLFQWRLECYMFSELDFHGELRVEQIA